MIEFFSVFVSPPYLVKYLVDFRRVYDVTAVASLFFDMQLLAAIADTFQKSTHYSLQVKLVSSAQD